MADTGLHLDQVGRVEVIVLSQIVVVARETLDCVGVVRECQHLEMSYISVGAAQTPRPAISWRRAILGKRDPLHQVQIGSTLGNWNHPVPYSSDHAALPSSEPTPARRCSSKLTSLVAHERSGSSPGS